MNKTLTTYHNTHKKFNTINHFHYGHLLTKDGQLATTALLLLECQNGTFFWEAEFFYDQEDNFYTSSFLANPYRKKTPNPKFFNSQKDAVAFILPLLEQKFNIDSTKVDLGEKNGS